MRAIPIKLRKEMSEDEYYDNCCMQGDLDCVGHIEWHHGLIYAGRQVNRKFAILPLCQKHHRDIDNRDQKIKINRIMLNRATEEELMEFSKSEDLIAKRDRLNEV